MVGLTTKTLKDGTGATFSGYFYDDGTALFPVHLIINTAAGPNAYGSGAAGATVPRFLLATDDPAVTSLAIMDDWDESDRAKVNIISGQAGVAANAGAASATTIRTVAASDSPDVTALAALTRAGLTGSLTFTPAATSHAAGDCVGAAGDFTLGAASGALIEITDAELLCATGTAIASAFRLHLYNVTPPSAIADDAAWDLASGDRTAYLGFVDLGIPIDMGSTLYAQNSLIGKRVRLSGTTVFGYLTNLTTVTLEAVAHTVKLHVEPIR